MANVACVVTNRSSGKGKDYVVSWPNVKNGDVCQWWGAPGAVLRSFGISGTLGAGGAAGMYASMSDTTKQGGDLGFTTPADETVVTGSPLTAQSNVLLAGFAAPSFRPKITAGDGSTSLTLVAEFTVA